MKPSGSFSGHLMGPASIAVCALSPSVASVSPGHDAFETREAFDGVVARLSPAHLQAQDEAGGLSGGVPACCKPLPPEPHGAESAADQECWCMSAWMRSIMRASTEESQGLGRP